MKWNNTGPHILYLRTLLEDRQILLSFQEMLNLIVVCLIVVGSHLLRSGDLPCLIVPSENALCSLIIYFETLTSVLDLALLEYNLIDKLISLFFSNNAIVTKLWPTSLFFDSMTVLTSTHF